jgi:hypothetical protein
MTSALVPQSMPHDEALPISTEAYSPKLVEEVFSEVRLYGVLRSLSKKLQKILQSSDTLLSSHVRERCGSRPLSATSRSSVGTSGPLSDR